MPDSKWQPIDTAAKDGSPVYVRRIHKGSLVKEGWAVFAVPVPDAPILQPNGPDPLGRPVDLAAEQRRIESARVTPRWMNPDRIYAFPEPTHWRDAAPDTEKQDWPPRIGEWRNPFADGFYLDWHARGFKVEIETEDGRLIEGQLEIVDEVFDGENEYPMWGVRLPDETDFIFVSGVRYRRLEEHAVTPVAPARMIPTNTDPKPKTRRVTDIISREQLAQLRAAGWVVIHREPNEAMAKAFYAKQWPEMVAFNEGFHRVVATSIRQQQSGEGPSDA